MVRIPPVTGSPYPPSPSPRPEGRTIPFGSASKPLRRVSFTRAELKSFTGATLPDLIAEGVRLLFVGINPGLRSVAVQGHFAPRGNRFYPALLRAGITDHLIDASAGLTARDRDYLLGRASASPAWSPGRQQAPMNSAPRNWPKAPGLWPAPSAGSARAWSPSWA